MSMQDFGSAPARNASRNGGAIPSKVKVGSSSPAPGSLSHGDGAAAKRAPDGAVGNLGPARGNAAGQSGGHIPGFGAGAPHSSTVNNARSGSAPDGVGGKLGQAAQAGGGKTAARGFNSGIIPGKV